MTEAVKAPRWVQWVRSASGNRWFPFHAALIVIVDYFFPVLPSTALVVSASVLAPKRWLPIAIGCSIGSALGALIIAFIFQQYGWLVIEWLFGDLRTAPQWETIQYAIQTFGLIALFLFSFLPMPLRVPTLVTTLAGVLPITIMIIVLIGRLVGYGLLAKLASVSPKQLLKFPTIRRSKTLVALLDEQTGPSQL
jgi:membrane protein YqaA with SNARE-associated domain